MTGLVVGLNLYRLSSSLLVLCTILTTTTIIMITTTTTFTTTFYPMVEYVVAWYDAFHR